MENGKEPKEQQEIKKAFYHYYAKLMKGENKNKEKLIDYLNKSKLPKISTYFSNKINKQITKEVIKFIEDLKKGKPPGPDGLTVNFYKVVKREVGEFLQEIMNKVMSGSALPISWNHASITLIHKENSDATNVKSYRPIYLLNIDYKVFAKILADRLKVYLNSYIGEEQTGFLPGRHLKNIRTVINLIEFYDKHLGREMGLVFMDAEKAFDNLDLGFMIEMLIKMEIGEKFVNAIKSIYNQQLSYLTINGETTKEFKINKGTRQGCPLSPLLFIFILEVLLQNIRRNEDLIGLKLKKYSYKFLAFADDIMFVMNRRNETIPRLFQEMQEFGDLVGLNINKNKTKIMCKNLTVNKQKKLEEVTGCEITNKMKYLGIMLTTKNLDLFKNNYKRIWEEIKKDMKRWDNLKLLLLGKIATIKRNILPRFMFLFQTLPIIKKESILNEWQKKINKYVWAGKKPRIKAKCF